jgi:hypothetical protein
MLRTEGSAAPDGAAPDGAAPDRYGSVLVETAKAAFEPRDPALRFLHRMEGPFEPGHPTRQAGSLLRELVSAALGLFGSPGVGFGGPG